jgi:hypothetical protein
MYCQQIKGLNTIYIIVFCLLKYCTMFGQTNQDSSKSFITVSPLKVDIGQENLKKIVVFADSINKYYGGPPPQFIFDVCFDWNASFWPDLHSPTSVRWQILEEVTNKKALKMILKIQDKRMKLKCSHITDKVYPYLTVPMINKSFYQLMRKRFRQL